MSLSKILLFSIILFCSIGFTATSVSAETNPPYTCADISQIPQAECRALLALHGNWFDGFEPYWFENTTPCSWTGITCGNGTITHLALSKVHISRLPDEMGSLQNLESLNIHDSLIGYMGEFWPSLTNLETIHLAHNQQARMNESMSHTPNLKSLTFVRNSMNSAFPSNIGELKSLQKLVFFENYGFKYMGDFFGELDNLEWLQIQGNSDLWFVPRTIGQLKKLTFLTIAQNSDLQDVSISLARENFPVIKTHWIDVPMIPYHGESDPNSENENGNNGEAEACIIPPSGPWPPCATDGTAPATPATGNDCVIPASGPWPPCATVAEPECTIWGPGPWPPCATGGVPGCEIPASGPWPDCAK